MMAADDVIDAHMHIWDADWLPEGLRWAWARQAAGRTLPQRRPEDIFPQVGRGQSDPDAAMTIAAFDRAGVTAGVIPVVDWTIVGAPAGTHLPIKELNAKYEEVAESWMNRIFFCAGVDPRHPHAREVFVAAVEHAHCRGMKLYPAAGWDLAEARHRWIYESLLEHDLPAVIHTSPLGGDPLQVTRSRPGAIAAMMAKHPSLTVVFAHAGVDAWWLEALDCATGWQNTYLEISLWQRVALRDYGEFRSRIGHIVSQLGAHRLIFGSDIIRGPRQDPHGDELIQWIDMVRGLAGPYHGEPAVLSDEQLGLVLSGNASRVFKIGTRAR